MTSTNHTIPLYDRGEAPEGLRTRKQWHQQGCRVRDDATPAAYIRWDRNAENKMPFAVYAEDATEPLPKPPGRDQRRGDRDAAATWARSILTDPAAVVVDCETSSLHEGRILEIAAVAADSTVVFHSLLNPGTAVALDPDSIAVHGITVEHIADAPLFADVLAGLTHALDGRTLVGWNVAYDRNVLTTEVRQVPADLPQWLQAEWYDAMHHYAAHTGEWDASRGQYRRHRLDGNHRAVGDCREVWARIDAMAGHRPDARTLTVVRSWLIRQRNAGAFTALTGAEAVDWTLRGLDEIQEVSR